MSVNSHPAYGFIHSVLDGRLTEAIVKAAAGTVGAAAGASGGGAVAALTSHGAAALVGYAIGRRSAAGDTGHARDTTGNDVGVGVYHDSNSAAAGQQQHYLKGARGYGDNEALLTGREDPRPGDAQVAWMHVGLIARHAGELSAQHRQELHDSELANADLWMDGEEMLTELTSTRETNARMRDWINTATRQIDFPRQSVLASGENLRPLWTEQELAERIGQLRASEYHLSFLRDELVRGIGDRETETAFRHAKELASLRRELEQACATNREAKQRREDAKEHDARVRVALTGARSLLQDKVSRLSRENRKLRDELVNAKEQVGELIRSRDCHQGMSKEKTEREGAEIDNAFACAVKARCSADAAATAGEEDHKETLSRAPRSTIASEAKATTAVEYTQNELINALERATKAESALEDNISSRTEKATIAAAVAATIASTAIRNELSAALERATKAENTLTAASRRTEAATTAEETMQARAEAIAMMIEGEAASGQEPPVTANMIEDILCRKRDAGSTWPTPVGGDEDRDIDVYRSMGARGDEGGREREVSEIGRLIPVPQLFNEAPADGNTSIARRFAATTARATVSDNIAGGATSHGLSHGAREATITAIGSSQRVTATQPLPGRGQGGWGGSQMHLVRHGAVTREPYSPLDYGMPQHGLPSHGRAWHHNNEADMLGRGSVALIRDALPRCSTLPPQGYFYKPTAVMMGSGGGNMAGGDDASSGGTFVGDQGDTAAGSGRGGVITTYRKTKRGVRAGKQYKQRILRNSPL